MHRQENNMGGIAIKCIFVNFNRVARPSLNGFPKGFPIGTPLPRRRRVRRVPRPLVRTALRPMLIGYARVSTLDQNLDLQRDALRQAG